jgi:hypothetical protein
MSVFDGLADIFTDTFGEAVIYTPVATGISKTINAIWWQSSLDLSLPGGDALVDVDVRKTELSVRSADISDPKEGDTAQRASDGLVMTVSTPIRP